jgi:GxxExxY protein
VSGAVIGTAIEAYKDLGPGFLESVYEEAICVELRGRGIPFARQVHFAVGGKGEPVGEGKVDLVVAKNRVVELKAVDALARIHTAQTIS